MAIDVIGIGLEGRAGLTDSIQKIIDRATILSGANRHLSYFSNHSVTKIPLNNLYRDIDLIISKATKEERVVILASGDPLFFGLGRLLLSKIPADKLQFHPHFSSIQLAFSKLKTPWQDAVLISVHGRDCDAVTPYLKQGTNKIAILTDQQNSPVAIAKLYLALKLSLAYSFHVCEDLTLENGKITSFAPSEIPKLARLLPTKFTTLNVLVLIREEDNNETLDYQQLPLLGIPDNAFLSFSDRPSLITKKEIRSVVISELALKPQQVIWDIGAGTGSVAIEIARLCPSARIYAIEKTAIGISLIERNCQRFSVKNIHPISAKAPQLLNDLPIPNRVFIGGSGGNLVSILTACNDKIASGGIIVIALATVEHFAEVLQWSKQNNWHYDLLQVQISRSLPIANLTRFAPLNPVTIVKLNRITNN